MNQTINLVECLLVKGRNLHQMGVSPQAQHLLHRLSGFRHLPDHVARETRLRLAQLYCKQKKYRRARRLLAALAVTGEPQARDHYLMGKAAAADVHCDGRLALRHFRRCVKLAPRNARYLSTLGMCALHNGREELALRALRRAFRLAPTSAVVIRRYLRVLRELRRLGEARRLLRVSRFRLGRQTWYQVLFAEFQLFTLRLRQRHQQRRPAPELQPRLLPFPALRLADTAEEEGQIVRQDGPAILPAPHLPVSLRRPDQRHAQ